LVAAFINRSPLYPFAVDDKSSRGDVAMQSCDVIAELLGVPQVSLEIRWTSLHQLVFCLE
jgi:hypothetical protein